MKIRLIATTAIINIRGEIAISQAVSFLPLSLLPITAILSIPLTIFQFISLGQFVENKQESHKRNDVRQYGNRIACISRESRKQPKQKAHQSKPYKKRQNSGKKHAKTKLPSKLFFSGLGAFLDDSSFHMIFSSFRWMKYCKNIVSTFCLFVKKVAHLIDVTDFSFVLRNILPGFVFKHACSNNPKQNITHQNSQDDMRKKENNAKEQSHQEPNTKDGNRQNKSLHEVCCGVYLLLPIKVFHCFPQHIDAQRVIS